MAGVEVSNTGSKAASTTKITNKLAAAMVVGDRAGEAKPPARGLWIGELHGRKTHEGDGCIELESIRDRGTRFRVLLPSHADAQPAAEPEREPVAAWRRSGRGRPRPC